MDDDQQFCLRWNNHQSTLVAVFDTLLENGTLVDCTLAAEGKCLNAHKVVLSACSPYFEALLSRHFDKHPILILKDVKFQELKAMMDYMYRGEVNISQDQLGALLKAAESLQIKGLSDNRKGETERKPAPVPPPPKSPQPTSALPKVQGLTIEQRSRDDSREGSMSPGPRKKKRLRRKSEELDNHDASNSSESHSLPAQNIPSSLPAVSKINADVPEPVETKSEILTRHKQPDDIPQVPIIKEKIETHTELMLEPKSEYVEEMNEDSIEDLTLDDDDLSNMEQMDDQAGPSHGNAGEGSSQGFGSWHMGNQSQDEVFLAAQEAVGAHRDSQGHGEKPILEVWKVEKVKKSSVKTVSGVKNKAAPKASQCKKSNFRKRRTAEGRFQHVHFYERNGKTFRTLRCISCNMFVSKDEKYCQKCKDYLQIENKSRQCSNCKKIATKGHALCDDCEKIPNLSRAKRNRKATAKVLENLADYNGKVYKKRVNNAGHNKAQKKFTNNFCCISCNHLYVQVEGARCQKCSKTHATEQLAINTVDVKNEFEAVPESQTSPQKGTLTSVAPVDAVDDEVKNIINSTSNVIETVYVDDTFEDKLKSSYYVSFSDINAMLEESKL